MQEFDRKMAEHLMGMKVNAPKSSQLDPDLLNRSEENIDASHSQSSSRLPLA